MNITCISTKPSSYVFIPNVGCSTSTEKCQNISYCDFCKYERRSRLWYISSFYCRGLSASYAANTPRGLLTNRNVGLEINLHEFQFYLLSCMVFLRRFAAGALITAPLPNVMKKLSLRYLLATLITKLGKFPAFIISFGTRHRDRNFTIQLLQNGEGRLFHPRMVLIRVCRVI